MQSDPLSWLLPEASAEERAALRRVVTALRLLRDDARAGARRVEPSWTRARGELERAEGLRRRRALEALLGAYLQALRPAHSFLELGARAPECGAAWRVLLASEPSPSLLPRPAEPPVAVVRRLLEAARAGGAAPGWSELWEARVRQLEAPGREAERHWETLFTRAQSARARPPHLARLLAGWVAACLECGRPTRALALHGPHAPLAVLDPSLRRLFGWSALLCGELERARVLLAEVAPARLPSVLAELRADVPECAALLAGEPDPPAAPLAPARLTREELGVWLVAVFALRPGGGAECLALDAPAAQTAMLSQAMPCADDALPERPCRTRRLTLATPALEHALGGPRTRALVRHGVRDPAGALAGWLQLESEHLGLPCAARLARLAEAWRAELLARRAARVPAEARACALSSAPHACDDPRAEFVAALRARLGVLGPGRVRWIEPGPGGGLVLRFEQGVMPGSSGLAPELVRTACERGTLVRSEPGAPWAGFGVPLLAPRARPALGVLCVELHARGSELEECLARARALLAELGPTWWATAFRAAWRAQGGGELAWDPASRFLAGLEPALRAADAEASLLIVGPRGSGRRTLAHCWHLRAARNAAERAELGARRVHELAELAPEAQRALARTESPLCLLADAPLSALRAARRLEPELERRLEPLPLCVPPLADRRDEIPGIVRALAVRVARGDGRALARFDEGAMAALWRQDWKGQVSGLAALVAQLVRAHGTGEPIGVAAVRAALHSRGLAFRERLPSLRPRVLDLELALASTRHQNGHGNHARAARYLGWDPETLAARLAGRVRRARRGERCGES